MSLEHSKQRPFTVLKMCTMTSFLGRSWLFTNAPVELSLSWKQVTAAQLVRGKHWPHHPRFKLTWQLCSVTTSLIVSNAYQQQGNKKPLILSCSFHKSLRDGRKESQAQLASAVKPLQMEYKGSLVKVWDYLFTNFHICCNLLKKNGYNPWLITVICIEDLCLSC